MNKLKSLTLFQKVLIVAVIAIVALVIWVSTTPKELVDLAEKCMKECQAASDQYTCLQKCKETGM